jgi:hypothetical protein
VTGQAESVTRIVRAFVQCMGLNETRTGYNENAECYGEQRRQMPGC